LTHTTYLSKGVWPSPTTGEGKSIEKKKLPASNVNRGRNGQGTLRGAPRRFHEWGTLYSRKGRKFPFVGARERGPLKSSDREVEETRLTSPPLVRSHGQPGGGIRELSLQKEGTKT